MNKHKDLAAGIVLGVFSFIYLFFAAKIKVFRAEGAAPIDAKALPIIWGCLLLIMSIALIVRSAIALKKCELNTRKSGLKKFWKKYYQIILTFFLLICYIALMEIVGFPIMTSLFLTGEILLLGTADKKPLIIVPLISVISAFVLYFVFNNVLHVMLPAGILGGVI